MRGVTQGLPPEFSRLLDNARGRPVIVYVSVGGCCSGTAPWNALEPPAGKLPGRLERLMTTSTEGEGESGRPPRHECRGFPLCSALAH